MNKSKENKIIAVLSSYYSNTMQWLLEEYKLKLDQINHNHNEIRLKDGTLLKVITNREQLLGLNIDEFIKAPDYWTLEDEAKQRLLISKGGNLLISKPQHLPYKLDTVKVYCHECREEMKINGPTLGSENKIQQSRRFTCPDCQMSVQVELTFVK